MSKKASNNVCIKTGSWCGDREVCLPFPGHWRVDIHNGSMSSSLDSYQIEDKLYNPVDGFRLQTLIKKDCKIAIVIDDHTRPTPVVDILTPLLKMIQSQDIKKENIKILVSLGTHILEDKSFARNKLGDLMDGDVSIIFPDCRDNDQYVHVGDSSEGIPIFINHYFAQADIKIAVSGIYPHDEAGFSGGAKILIGILGLETISRFHRKHGLLERGSIVDSDFRKELEHFADIANLSYSVNCIINDNKKITDLYCGDFRKSFRMAVDSAKRSLATFVSADADVIISNAYPLDTSLSVIGKSRWPFNYSKKESLKIIITSLCDCSGERVALATTQKEILVQKIKKLSGATDTKKYLKETLLKAGNFIDSEFKWKNNYIIFVPHVDRRYNRKPTIINNCVVQYDWDSIINEILSIFGSERPVNVSIFPCAPLLFPVQDKPIISD